MTEKFTEEQLLKFKEQHEEHRQNLIEMIRNMDFIQCIEYNDLDFDDSAVKSLTIKYR